jgi:hypothetical protein
MAIQSTTNINSDFFKGIYKEVWRREIPNGLTEAETDFIEEIAHLSKLVRCWMLCVAMGDTPWHYHGEGIMLPQ